MYYGPCTYIIGLLIVVAFEIVKDRRSHQEVSEGDNDEGKGSDLQNVKMVRLGLQKQVKFVELKLTFRLFMLVLSSNFGSSIRAVSNHKDCTFRFFWSLIQVLLWLKAIYFVWHLLCSLCACANFSVSVSVVLDS